MTTSEQAALLAKHLGVHQQTGKHVESEMTCLLCYEHTIACNGYDAYISLHPAPFPCDVHKMAELKDAEIAELRRENGELALKLAFRSGDLAAMKVEHAEIAPAVSEVVERIVSVLEERNLRERERCEIGQCRWTDEKPCKYHRYVEDELYVLRSRDWSKGDER